VTEKRFSDWLGSSTEKRHSEIEQLEVRLRTEVLSERDICAAAFNDDYNQATEE